MKNRHWKVVVDNLGLLLNRKEKGAQELDFFAYDKENDVMMTQ